MQKETEEFLKTKKKQSDFIKWQPIKVTQKRNSILGQCTPEVKMLYKINQNKSKTVFNLGVMYSKGDLVKKDQKEAEKYYQKAVDYNISRACFNLGVLYC